MAEWKRKNARLLMIGQHSQNMTCQMFVDFTVARHGLGDFRGGILIPVMFASVPDKHAT